MHINELLNINANTVFRAIIEEEELLPRIVSRLLRHELSILHAESSLKNIVQLHPLGFLCLKWNLNSKESLRMHIWNREFDWIQNPNWPIHDHIFEFKSTVLFGEIQHKTYEIDLYGRRRPWNVYEVKYGTACSNLMVRTQDIGLKILSTQLQRAGSVYELASGKLHRSILRSNLAVTVLATTACSLNSNPPRVIGSHSFQDLNFSRIPAGFKNIRNVIQHTVQLLEIIPFNRSLD